MSKNRNLLVALFISFSAASCLWAGKEFTANPGEPVVADQLIVKLRSGASINQVLASAAPQAVASLVSSHWNSYLLKLPPGIQNIISKALAALPMVEYVEPNRVRKTNIVPPNDPNYATQWGLVNIQALQAWNYLPDLYLTAATAGTTRVKVAVLDTGVDCTHPDFKNLGGTSTDSAQGGQLLFASSQALVATTVASPTCAWQDDHGHGTHTAGIVAAATQNGTGIASVGYPLQVIVYKVLDATGSGSDSGIAQAIEAAADAGAKVVSMSLGGMGYSQTLQNAIEYAWQHNTLVVSAAGNTGDNQLFFPGAANHALGVAATDTTNARASFSTFGNWVKIAAPGVNILSTLPTYANPLGALNYGILSGTSMATPHVAAVAGLVSMANPNLSVAAIAQRLQRSAQTPNAGWDQFIGYGVLNAAGAVSGILGSSSLGGLVGQVVDSSNLPVTGATVVANGLSFTTAADGLFRIANLSPGTFTLTASATGFAAVNMQAAVLRGSDTMLMVRMGVSVGEFTGTVTSSGLPVAGAVVEGVSGGVIQSTAISDANGTYALYLTPGTYDLTASAPGDINNTVASQVLTAGQTKTVNLTISSLGNLVGAVKDSSGAPVASARIDIVGVTFSAGATADASGNFSTIGLPSGTYTATASASGFSNVSLTGINVSPNVSTPVTLQFSPTSDTTPPSVSITAPIANTTVSNTITVTATASDNVAVGDVQFQLDGLNLGADLTTAPYSISWNTTTVANGTHTLTAIAHDTSHNPATSTPVTVTVSNTTGGGPPTTGLIGYWNFDEGSGSIAHDTSGSGYNGVVNGAAWTAGKINSGLNFNGFPSVITPSIPLGGTFSVSAWVNPALTGEAPYVRIAETQYSAGLYLGTNITGSKYKFFVNYSLGSTGTCGAQFGCAEGGAVTSGWHLVTGTFDGTTARLYVDTALVANDTFTAPAATSIPLHIGEDYNNGGYGWNGTIDEARLYNRALTAGEISAIYTYTGGTSDTTPPSTPANVSATAVSSSQINVSWSASTDNVGVTGYRVVRNGGLAGTVTTLAFSDSGLAASTTYSYTVAALDAAGNVSNPSTVAMATTLPVLDTTPPSVSITAPLANATVSNTITVTATASDNVAVGDVQFQLDGVNLGADLTTAPYSISWNTTTASNGTHTLTAIAHDTSHNPATSTPVTVTVSNTTGGGPPTSGLVGYWNFDEGSGSIAHDTSGSGYNGVVNGAAWTAGKINSGLNFNGFPSVITPSIPLGGTFSVSAWVNPAVTGEAPYVRIAETQYSVGLYLGTNITGSKYKFFVNYSLGSTGTCGAQFGCAEGGAVTSGWHLVTGTFDGTTARLYVDTALVANDTFTAPAATSIPLHIGEDYNNGGYGWNGTLDEVRLYNRALTAAEVLTIYNFTGGTSDTTPPSTPANVSATAVSSSQINVSWSASTDNVGVTGYRVVRNGGLAGTVTTLAFSDSGLAASTTYSYTVAALDAAGNVSNPSTVAMATTLPVLDTTPPSVSITAPLANATVSNTITVTATASDNVAVGDVQFQLDGVNLGADLTTAPYSISWNTTTASNGTHTLTAIAHDTSHNPATSTPVTVTVSNTTGGGPPTTGLIGYWNFDEGSGSIAHDTSGSGYNGVVNGAAWTAGKINSGLNFNGFPSVITPSITLGGTFSVSAWVNPALTGEAPYVRIAETQYWAGLYLGTNITGTKYKFIVNYSLGSTGTCGAQLGCAEGGAITSGWHLVTGTFDGTTARLYVDATLVASDTFTAPPTTSLPLHIGEDYNNGGYGWNGAIDETRLYNRALTAAEVVAIFNQ